MTVMWCRSCGTVTSDGTCDCTEMGQPELRDAIPDTNDAATPAFGGEALSNCLLNGACTNRCMATDCVNHGAHTTEAAAISARREYSENERHAIAHAKYLCDQASPSENPEVCFDFELVRTLLSLIPASPPEQPATPAVDGEREALQILIRLVRMKVMGKTGDVPSEVKFAEAVLAARPASPLRVEDARHEVANWMIGEGYVTGHGDTLDDLMQELVTQAQQAVLSVASSPPEQPAALRGRNELADKLLDRWDANDNESNPLANGKCIRLWIAELDAIHAALSEQPAAAPVTGRETLEQIAIVCTDNMDRDCNHRMALDFVRQIANNALKSTTALSAPERPECKTDREAAIEDCAALMRRWANDAAEHMAHDPGCVIQHNVCRNAAVAISNLVKETP